MLPLRSGQPWSRLLAGAGVALLAAGLTGRAAPPGGDVFLEAGQFAEQGGWELDQQSMDQMGSPYLLAHGLGVPVPDATTTARFPAAGVYHVWVRTRDWVAPWGAPGAPGKFELRVDGTALPVVFGTEGAAWHWQDGGVVSVGREARVALHDLTGFDGRCDAVVFRREPSPAPPGEAAALAAYRWEALGLPAAPEDGGEFDLVVVGGGIAGSSAALSAARQGLRVALVQDRPVLGGNGSSEVRVWPEGKTRQAPYYHVGEIVEELVAQKGPGDGNAKGAAVYADERKLSLVRAEPRIKLLTEQRVEAVAAGTGQITSVVARHVRTARRLRLRARLFADCTGDGTVGFLAGADFEESKGEHQGLSNLWNVMDAADPRQVLQCECKDKTALALATQAGEVAAPFPHCPWALDLRDKPFPGRQNFRGQWGAANPLDNLGGWFWESGFHQDPVNDVEQIRDLNLRAMFGAWDALKNVDHLYPNHRIGWAAFIAGKRESRRLLGDVVLQVEDFRLSAGFPDGAFPCSWHIDLHGADPEFKKVQPGEEFISRATEGAKFEYQSPFWAPYRCLYSRNITNLFMAGRDISVSHEALGPVRVMRTCGMMGEVVGKAAWLCVRHHTTPRGVYVERLNDLQDLLRQPGAARRATREGQLALPPGVTPAAEPRAEGRPTTAFAGIVVDDEQAELHGQWSGKGGLTGYVGRGYRYSSDPAATARFPFQVARAGEYEVRTTWLPHANRARTAPVTIRHADGETTVTVDQTRGPGGEQGFQTLGRFRFTPEQASAVTFRVAGAGGIVHIDAVQMLPLTKSRR